LLLCTIVVVIVFSLFLHCIFLKIYSSIRLSKPQVCNKVSVNICYCYG